MDISVDEPSTSSCNHQDDEEGKNIQLLDNRKNVMFLFSCFNIIN